MNKLLVCRVPKRRIVKKQRTINLSNTALTSKTNVKTDDNADMDSYQREYKNISEHTLTVIIIILPV